MNNEKIEAELKKHSDEAYQKFSASLLPGINNIDKEWILCTIKSLKEIDARRDPCPKKRYQLIR